MRYLSTRMPVGVMVILVVPREAPATVGCRTPPPSPTPAAPAATPHRAGKSRSLLFKPDMPLSE
ncbi:hypothetical protein CP969_22345 [Streptomyces viridosporus T7A]|uniref:Secreted protein n=1 Tax=Streptomyces viridosporus T7A TaxID=665577 RepID=A0ABX6AIP6_STRVD|nr:hypothetical protein CP969_22345 [Streptomyces viridosporus T7A]